MNAYARIWVVYYFKSAGRQAEVVDKHPPPTYYSPIMASDRIQRRINSLLDEADAAVSRYDWEALREAAQAVLRLDPENSDALAYLAAAQRDTGSSQPAQASPAPHPVPAPIGDQPHSFANGRYQVKRFLGEGGKKRVYLAHDTTLDRW